MQILAWLRAQFPAGSTRGDLQVDSRAVGSGDVFIALPGVIPGRADDGRRYLEDAAARGAVAALVEASDWEPHGTALPVLPVHDLRRNIGLIAARFYGNPTEAMQVVGVTGTNGKTSCSYFTAQVLTHAGRRCAVLGTLGGGFPGEALSESALTTPEATGLQREVRRLREAGARALALEVSSIALDQSRVNGMKFDVALFTNLTRDHLDYHRTMADYEAAKARLFDWPTLTDAVVNLDDAAGRRLAARLAPRARAGALRVTGYSADPHGVTESLAGVLTHQIGARDVRVTAQGIVFTLICGRHDAKVEVPLLGLFNVANLLGVAGTAAACGVDFATIVRALPHLLAPPGRMQRVRTRAPHEPLLVIDYAHTPDALEQALLALRPVAQARGGRLWAVFGAGGDRDPGKRELMGAAASKGADRIVLTSDNPRSEDPQAIIAAIAAGTTTRLNVEIVVDRARAIAEATHAAAPADVVLVAGKGHENYQEVAGRRLPFSDVEHARTALLARGLPA
jgi:UDP-N-acetylmuramoyl-L-alanyl-D-glutamate--2,6-diaminopimelate ligase